MDITIEGLNALGFEQTVCFHVVVCSFVAQHQCELLEAELMEQSLINRYRGNVQNTTPDAFRTELVPDTQNIAWNLISSTTNSITNGRNTEFATEVAMAFNDTWKKAMDG